MKTFSHPSEYIDPSFAAIIRNVSAEAERLNELHPEQLKMILEQKWFQLFVPKYLNGLGLELPVALQKEEGIAWADGSVGWTVTLCSGAAWFVGFLDPALVPAVFNADIVCLAGSGKPSGVARIVHDGYEITGYWDYATGSAHATAFTANCIIKNNDSQVMNEDGSVMIQSFLFFRDEVTIHKKWRSMGMIATGSNSFEATGLVVKKNRAFCIDHRYATLPYPVYRYPFLQLAETTLAVNSSGMAVRFLDLCQMIFEKKTGSFKKPVLADAVEQLDKARAIFYGIAEDSWRSCINSISVPSGLLKDVSHASRQLALTARRVVDELYPYCGLYAADPGTEINRVWRNLHTASQHSLFNREHI